MIRQLVLRWAQRYMARRQPDFSIFRADGSLYLKRWWVLPRNRVFNIYLHNFVGDDDDRALHDHPWINMSWILDGGYYECLRDGIVCNREPGKIVIRRSTTPHRVLLRRDECGIVNSISLFVTGPAQREWGFHCPQGWRQWQEFVKVVDGGNSIGRGCA